MAVPHSSKLTINAWIMLFVIGLLVFLMNIDYTAVNLALVPISDEIDGDLNILQWLLSGYVLIWAALVVPAGRFADIYGKKFSLVLGVAIFILGSIIVGMGSDVLVLIAGRLIQGFGAAVFSSPAYSIIFISVPPQKQGMAMGFIGGTAGLGLAIGPTLAGWIINNIGWRWLFYVNVPLGLVVMIVLMIYAASETKPKNSPPIDWLSVILLISGFGTFFFALNQIEAWGISNPLLLGLGTGGIALLALFFYRDRNQTFQALPREIINNRSFMSLVVACFITSYCFSLILIMMSLYLQNTLKLTSSETGIYFLSMTLALGLLSPLGGKLADHMDIRIPLTLGFGFTFLSLLILGLLNVNSSTVMVCSGLLLAGLGLGIGFPSMNTGMFRALNPQEINTGSAVFTMSMMLGNSISVIISTSILVLFGQPHLLNLLAEEGLALTTGQQSHILGVLGQVGHSAEHLKQFPADQIPTLLKLIDQAFLHGFSITLWIGMCLSALAAGIVLRYLGNPKSISSASISAIL